MTRLRRLVALMDKGAHRRFYLLIGAVIILGITEVVGVASIFPFMQLLSNPDVVHEQRYLSVVYDWLGFQTVDAYLIFLGFAVLGFMAATSVMAVVVRWVELTFVWDRVHALSCELLEKYLYRRYPYFLAHSSSDLAKQVLFEAHNVGTAVLLPLVELLARSFLVIVLFSLLLFVDAELALIVFAALGLVYTAIYLGLRQYLLRLGGERFEANRRRFKMATEALGSMKVIKITGREQFFAERFVPASRKLTAIIPKYQLTGIIPQYFIQTLAFGGIILILLYMLAAGSDVQEVLPTLSLFALAAYRLMPALQGVFRSVATIRYNIPVVDSLYEDLLDSEFDSSRVSTGTVPPIPFNHAIELQKVHFSYSGERDSEVLHGVDLCVPKGGRVALVGQTGSGKTTLIDVLVGLLEPTQGRVCVDGVPIESTNVRSWLRSIGYVPQEVTLYDETILRNITFGTHDDAVDMDRVRHVAAVAQIHEFIETELPDGYQTVVGERGLRLSGGQRQRIGLARALYLGPQLLILDEATNALDGITETDVLNSIQTHFEDMTVIMIAHRLSSVQHCDEIHLLSAGRIVASGPYERLVSENSMFRSMALAVPDN